MTREEALAFPSSAKPDNPCLPAGCDVDEMEPSSGGTWYCPKCHCFTSDEIVEALRVKP